MVIKKERALINKEDEMTRASTKTKSPKAVTGSLLEKASACLWNICTDAAVDEINSELSAKEFERRTSRFTRRLERFGREYASSSIPKDRHDACSTALNGVVVVKTAEFRSQPFVNTESDMVRVVLDMPNRTWRKLKSSLSDNVPQDG